MFGKRSNQAPDNRTPRVPQSRTIPPAPAPVLAPQPAPPPAPSQTGVMEGGRAPIPSAGLGAPLLSAPPAARRNLPNETSPPLAPTATDSRRSEAYYETKGTIFGALIEAIDLAQLAKLDAEAAREEIRDIVNEIIAIKAIVMSISEQEELLDDICNDVLGYGPLEPLLARDDIADIMVNGSGTIYIEVKGKIQKTGIRFRDNQQLLNICQRIVSQIGRRVDESSPICDARLPDGSRVNVIVPPLAIDGPALTIRKFKKDKLTLDQLVQFGTITPEGAEILEDHRPLPRSTPSSPAAPAPARPRCSTASRNSSTTTSASSPARTRPNCNCSSRMWCGSKRGRPTSRAKARSPCAIWSRTACACGPSASSSAKCADPRPSTCLQAMNTGHDGSMGTLHANRPREALSRLESMITMGGYSLPSRTIREMIVRLGRRGRAGRAPARRLAPHHPRHRGDGHGRRRHHHAGSVRLRHDGRGRERQPDRPASLDRHRPAALLGSRALLRRGEAARRRARRRRGRRRTS